jgi:hypothetical protein
VPSASAVTDRSSRRRSGGHEDQQYFDDYYGALLATGFTPSTEPRRQRSGSREFLIKDPDGNALAFFAK